MTNIDIYDKLISYPFNVNQMFNKTELSLVNGTKYYGFFNTPNTNSENFKNNIWIFTTFNDGETVIKKEIPIKGDDILNFNLLS